MNINTNINTNIIMYIYIYSSSSICQEVPPTIYFFKQWRAILVKSTGSPGPLAVEVPQGQWWFP